MNLFVLDKDPVKAAQLQCDKQQKVARRQADENASVAFHQSFLLLSSSRTLQQLFSFIPHPSRWLLTSPDSPFLSPAFEGFPGSTFGESSFFLS